MWLKLEQLQHTGSFKARGALNRILSAAEQGMIPAAGVVAASGGNAGIAVAYAAARQNVPARVYVPLAVPEVKVARLREYGAEVVRSGSRYAESYEEALKYAADAARCSAIRTTSPRSAQVREHWAWNCWSRRAASSTRSWSRSAAAG